MKQIRIYKKPNNEEPFTKWLDGIMDKQTQSRILRRLDQLEAGNEGDYKFVGQGVYELRLAFGPGYRIYYGKDRDIIVILLCAGDKSTQKKDIERAQKYWKNINGDS